MGELEPDIVSNSMSHDSGDNSTAASLTPNSAAAAMHNGLTASPIPAHRKRATLLKLGSTQAVDHADDSDPALLEDQPNVEDAKLTSTDACRHQRVDTVQRVECIIKVDSPPDSPLRTDNSPPPEHAESGDVGSSEAGGDKDDAQPTKKRRPPLTRGISRNKSDPKILPVDLFWKSAVI